MFKKIKSVNCSGCHKWKLQRFIVSGKDKLHLTGTTKGRGIILGLASAKNAQGKKENKMKVNSYRLELTRLNGEFYTCQHFLTTTKAEQVLYEHSRRLEDNANVIQTNKRFGTIWESKLIITR